MRPGHRARRGLDGRLVRAGLELVDQELAAQQPKGLVPAVELRKEHLARAVAREKFADAFADGDGVEDGMELIKEKICLQQIIFTLLIIQIA